MLNTTEETKTNRKFKDSVFTRLFSEKNNLLELYNAICLNQNFENFRNFQNLRV